MTGAVLLAVVLLDAEPAALTCDFRGTAAALPLNGGVRLGCSVLIAVAMSYPQNTRAEANHVPAEGAVKSRLAGWNLPSVGKLCRP
jgi:hypothetical protein